MKYSIQHKIFMAFSIIIFIGLYSLLFVSYKINEQNTSHIIKNDMIEAKKNLDIYLNQYFLINNVELDKVSLENEADNISKEISSEIGNSVEIYSSDGKKLSSSFVSKNIKSKDMDKALKGNVAYSIVHKGNNVYVNLSYPIEANNSILGIMKYSKDYSSIFMYNKKFKIAINFFAAMIFIFVFVTSFIISRKIAKPIKELTKSSEQVSLGEFDLEINIDSKDEIGELAERFKIMIKRIKEQIEIIEKDRDALVESQAQSKTFFDNATHELKTPLTTILGYAQMMQDNGFSDKDFFDKGMNYIINESQRLNNMVIEILELSKNSSKNLMPSFERVNLYELISETCEEMRIKGRKYNIKISCDLQQQLFLKGNYYQLKEVLINLIDNSIKYGQVNSTIYIYAFKEGKDITLTVKDSGIGIPEEHIKNLFEPFFRVAKNVSREKGSAGLGLTIVKNIVEIHGGTININSKPGQGTEVNIKFNVTE